MFQNKTFRLGAGSLFFLAFCQSMNQLLNSPIVCNRGIGYGIDISLPIFIPLVLCALTIAGFFVWKSFSDTSAPSILAISGGALLLGGALSNIADRLIQGCVPDFFHLSWFPVFNMADIGISLGAFLLLASSKYKKDA